MAVFKDLGISNGEMGNENWRLDFSRLLATWNLKRLAHSLVLDKAQAILEPSVTKTSFAHAKNECRKQDANGIR